MHLIEDIEFSGPIWQWRGPAPFYFVTVPPDECIELKRISKMVSYGWGMIPVKAAIGETEWETSLFPNEGSYVIPLKKIVREQEKLTEGDTVKIRLTLRW